MKEELEKLRKEFNERIDSLLTPKIKNGVWYKYTNSDIHLVCFTDYKNQKGYGIDSNGWTNSIWKITDLVEAKCNEIESFLIKEADKRGLVFGNDIKSLEEVMIPVVMKDLKYYYDMKEGKLYSSLCGYGGLVLFHDGKWAEVFKNKDTELWVKEFYGTESSKMLLSFLNKNNLQITKK